MTGHGYTHSHPNGRQNNGISIKLIKKLMVSPSLSFFLCSTDRFVGKYIRSALLRTNAELDHLFDGIVITAFVGE